MTAEPRKTAWPPRTEQVTELKAVHRQGQTFLTWKEADPPVKDDTLSMAKYVKRNPALADEIREALRFGIYLMTEAREGRLNIPYGSDDCLSRMKAALDEIGRGARRDGSGAQRSEGAARAGAGKEAPRW